MTLPADFLTLMGECYGEREAHDLCAALEHSDPSVSVRLNMPKLRAVLDEHDLQRLASHLSATCDPVPWCPHAWYLPQRPPFTFDPLLHAGAYYVQEASSMYVAEMVCRHLFTGQGSQPRPVAALDLCAAPGGKSTLLAGLLPEGSLLLSNEVMPKRAQVLAENMTKWTSGMPAGQYPVASLVSQNRTASFAAFAGQFDLLVADVPCSGEGMFRKDEQAVRDWSLDNVRLCCQRQREILDDVAQVLRPGGLLLYSTCTFNRHEDEEGARYACALLGGQLLEERHFLPGRDRGEGFYVAAIRKPLDAPNAPSSVSSAQPTPAWESDAQADEAQSQIRLQRLAERVRRYLHVLFDSTQVPADVQSLPRVNLSYDQALRYLRHEAVRVEAPRGLVTLCYKGFPLGQGKGVGTRVNNLYPAEWRIRTGYTTPFTLFPE